MKTLLPSLVQPAGLESSPKNATCPRQRCPASSSQHGCTFRCTIFPALGSAIWSLQNATNGSSYRPNLKSQGCEQPECGATPQLSSARLPGTAPEAAHFTHLTAFAECTARN